MDNRSLLSRTAKVAVIAFVASMLLAEPLLNVALAQPKEAPGVGAGGGLPVAITGDMPKAMSSAYNNVITELTRAGVVAFMNALQVFFGQLAYDAANYIASGGNGQSAVFYKKGFGQYIRDVASDSAGEFMGSLSNGQFFQNAGFNLCQPKDPRTLLRIQLSLGNFFPGQQGQFSRPRPKCDFKDVIDNWETVGDTLSNSDAFDNIQSNFNTNANDIGIASSVFNYQVFKVSQDVTGKDKERQEGGGFKAVTDVISGRVKTPGQVVSEATKDEIVRSPKSSQMQVTGAILQNAFQTGPIQLLNYTASVFLNTLGSKMMKRIFEKGLDAFDFSDLETKTAALGPDNIVTQSATDARKANIDLRTPRLQTVATFEIMSELTACPSAGRGLWNCAMDQALAQAVQPQGGQGGMTISEAIERDFLHGNWKLIPEALVRENRDPLCYTYGYCVGNLQKLRLARILPVGFEFAASSPENVQRCNSSAGCVTLKEVVDHFSDCNTQGLRDASHPWCHLVDPNWVLTTVAQQCALSGYGDSLLSGELGQRKQECQDIQTCLQRNDKGECIGGYGYCMAEKTVYRFQADECPARFASCRNYTNRESRPVSYLRNTLDYAQCSADNVGCLWYATTRQPTSTTEDIWVGTTSAGPRVYFDKNIEDCPAGDEGCTKLYRGVTGQSALNLVLNPSFEQIATDTQATLLEWLLPTPQTTTTVATGTPYLYGGASHEFSNGADGSHLGQPVNLVGGRTYTLSMSIRSVSESVGAAFLTAGITQYTQDGATNGTAERDFRGIGCTQMREVSLSATSTLSSAWQRYQCTFFAAPSTVRGQLNLHGRSVRVDGVQLEESEFATAFVDGINTDLQQINLKLPPDDLGCTGASTDVPACNKFARMCRQIDAGCDGYTDVAGGAEIPGILSTNDTCPATCVGYAEYRKQRSAFDYTHDVDPRLDDPRDTTSTYFIPRTAAQCTQAEVGCEEFTNMSASGTDAERSAYFSYVRACEKPDENTQTYFTWEGSDVTGFQLRTWSLKKAAGAGTAPRMLVKLAPDQNAIKEPSACNEASWRSRVDVDCRQFYTAAGEVHYVFFSQTVLSTNQCTTYRLNRVNQADCDKTGGNYNATSGECFYNVFEPESRSCSAAAVGCRAYAGAGAGNVVTLLTADFRQTTNGFAGGTLSSEALLVGDSSLRLPPVSSGGSQVFTTHVAVTTTRADLLRISFWAKAPGATVTTMSLQTSVTPTSTKTTVGTIVLTPDWQQYTIGLFNAASSSRTVLTWNAAVSRSGSFLFIDEVTVSRVRDMVYARDASWQTPLECDQTNYGVPQPQAMLGCRQYTNRRNEISNVRQFSRLCRQEFVGCTAFVDTRNSDSVKAETFVQADRTPVPGFGPATTVRPADRYVYAIDDLAKRCPASSISCKAFGLPQYSVDRQTIDRYTTIYVKDDITKYNESLCKPSELFCEAFTRGGATEYFRDPKTHACQYKENVTVAAGAAPGVAAGTYSGWFRAGEGTIPCYPTALESGSMFNILRTGDAGYEGYGAVCAEEHGECSEFRDTNDHTDPLHTEGKPYYFIRNDRLDTSSCAGNVDIGKGCVLMRDLSDPISKYNTEASYTAYEKNNFRPVQPVNCDSNPGHPECLAIKRCGGTRTDTIVSFARMDLVEVPAVSSAWVGDACTSDIECTRRVVEYVTPISSQTPTPSRRVTQYTGTCGGTRENDSNILLKVKMDRDCSQWLGCQSSETVYDAATSRYKDVCTNLALCDRSSGTTGDTFCSHYVKRDLSIEPILTAGAYFDINRYVKRSVGLGQRDYSGYTIPNSFQVPDLLSTRVAVEGLASRADVSRYAQDYRLAATAMIPRTGSAGRCTYPAPNETQARILCPDVASTSDGLCATVSDIAARYPDLKLCQHVNGRVGFYRETDFENGGNDCRPVTCYLPVSGENDSLDFNNLSQKFNLEHPEEDALLSQAYPPPECRAHPEGDSPFPISYVEGWDTSKNPPRPESIAQGYQNAKICEFGEDCVCTYKRVSYPTSAVTKFYNIYSQNVPPGICQGGPREGQSCIPESIFKAPSKSSVKTDEGKVQVTAIEGSNAAQSCGPVEGGGRCVALSKIEIVRGYFGQCLEHDSTRASGATGADNPCLTWNPTPILFGDKDIYHFIPTAGYLPPENAGQYYCTSYARKPQTIRLNSHYFAGAPFAGTMSKIDYDDEYVSDGDCFACGGNKRGAAIDGGEPKGSQVADQCEYTDDDQDDDDQEKDENALRLVGTGRAIATSYTETFFKVKSDVLGSAFFKIDPERATREQIFSAALESNFGYITINPIRNANGHGRLACGYQADWVDGLGSLDYDKVDEVKQKDSQWHQKFDETYNPTLTRGSETLFTRTSSKNPIAVPCITTNAKDPQWSQCYLKFWETKYHMGDADEGFRALLNDNGSEIVRSLEDIRLSPYYNECKGGKPYFGIRAVFQTDADSAAQGGLISSQIEKDNIQGPWRFVGFWVTSCAAKANDYRYIYMNVDMTSADICKELAEVKSRDSRQDAAFTDRVWKEGKFTLPGLGLQYGSRFSPFSSALNTKPAGVEPLFQTGNSIAGFSPLNPPTFLSSGVDTYYRPGADPKDKWAYLSNIFARVYRVYRYHEQAVSKIDTACTDGPFKGQRCTRPNVSDGRGGVTVSAGSPQCNPNGVCKSGELSADELRQFSFCNSMSGANAGLSCSNRPDICHSAAVDPRNDVALRLSCEVQPTWTKSGEYWKRGTEVREWTQKEAADAGAFGCPDTWYSLRGSGSPAPQGRKCSAPMENSPECPMLVVGRCSKPGGGVEGRMPGKCQLRLPSMASDGAYNWPRLGGPETATNRNNMVDVAGAAIVPGGSTAAAPLSDSNTHFQWVNANSSAPSCYTDSDCMFTVKQFYLKGPYSYTGNWPLFSARSRMAQPGNAGCGSTPLDAACLSVTQVQTTRANGIEPYRSVMDAGWNAYYSAQMTRAWPGRPVWGGNLILNGMYGNPPNPRGFLVDELDRWPGTGSAANATTEMEQRAIAIGSSIPGVSEFLNFFGVPTPSLKVHYNLAACEPATNFPPNFIGKCMGGLKDGNLCRFQNAYTCTGGTNAGGPCSVTADCPGGGACNTSAWSPLASRDPNDPYSCSSLPVGDSNIATFTNSCGPVSVRNSQGVVTGPVPACANPSGRGLADSDDPNLDNNVCTHGAGYYPRLDLCPDPSDEFCGLMSYDITQRAPGQSMDPRSVFRLPTDVTPGHYQPNALGFSSGSASQFNYISYYRPQPPRVAAPDNRACPTPGQCPIQRTDAFAFNGQSEGIINISGGQHKSSIKFYGWAAHNQMPLRAVSVDWGDGFTQSLPDARLKNHKPFCSVQGECSDPIKGVGITCQTDSDCPSGAGVCKPMGTCARDAAHICRVDDDCTVNGVKDKCLIRTFFGNTPEACEANFFDFNHVYSCTGPASVGNRNCTENGTEGRCSRDPSRSCGTGLPACAPGDSCIPTGLAPPGGCWDGVTNSCRFTPRVWMQDNWGWCTGECRTLAPTPTTLVDSPSTLVKHNFGGCYAGATQGSAEQNVRRNDIPVNSRLDIPASRLLPISECNQLNPGQAGGSNMRPWIVYPGALYLRTTGER